MEGNMKQWALHYAGLGLAVFPIKPGSKQPLTDHGLKDASKEPVQIERWWTRWPTANIGIATGAASDGLVVIDLDVDKDKGIDGRVTLREWEAEHEKLPDSTWLAITGRGGYHYFYHEPHRDLRGDRHKRGWWLYCSAAKRSPQWKYL